MDLENIRTLIRQDMKAVDTLIQERLQSDVALISQLSHYITKSGGKRLRPMTVLLAAHACGYEGEHHVHLAAIIELIHTATLLHDDVVDASQMRRGQDTANTIWGNEASVLVGDFLYSRSFEMMVDIQHMRVMEILAHTTNAIAEGEVMQLLNCNDPNTTEERYLEVIRRKTAKLFEAGTQLGGVISGASNQEERALTSYGMHLGTAFQLIDDVLDYSACAEEIGKNIGDDLAEGKPTLPLIQAMKAGTQQQAAIIRQAIEQGGGDDVNRVIQAIETTGAITYTANLAKQEAQRAVAALAIINDSLYKQALQDLAEFAVHRSY